MKSVVGYSTTFVRKLIQVNYISLLFNHLCERK